MLISASRWLARIKDFGMAEESKEKLQIWLHVYKKEFPVYVFPDEEPVYRDAAQLITATINRYAAAFSGRKTEMELLYMALIEIAVRLGKEAQRNDTKPYSDILEKLTSEIETLFKEGESQRDGGLHK